MNDAEIQRYVDEQRELTLQIKAKNESLFLMMSDVLNRVGKKDQQHQQPPQAPSSIDNVAPRATASRSDSLTINSDPILDDEILSAEQELLQQKSTLTAQLGSLLEKLQELQRRNVDDANAKPKAETQIAHTIALRRPLPTTQMYRHIEEFEQKTKDLHERLAGLNAKIGNVQRFAIRVFLF